MLDYLVRILFDGKQADGETTKVNASLHSVESTARRLAGAFGLAFGTHEILRYAGETIRWAAAIEDSAARAQVGIEKWQEWSYAAKKAGASEEALTMGLKRLAVALTDASAGKGEAFEAFRRLGITLADLKSSSPERMFEQLAFSFSRLPDSAQRTADAIALLGRGADSLLPAFREGFGKAAQEARDLGLIIDKDDVAAMKRLDDAIERLKTRGRVVAGEVIGSFANPKFSGADYARQVGRQTMNDITPRDVAAMPFIPAMVIGSKLLDNAIAGLEVERFRGDQRSAGLVPSDSNGPVTREMLDEIKAMRKATEGTQKAVEEKL